MRPKDLIDQLLVEALSDGLHVKVLSTDDFTIAIITDEDNQLIEAYLSKGDKIVPLPLKDVLDEYWQQHHSTTAKMINILPNYELDKAKWFILYCLERRNPMPIEDLQNKFVCQGISHTLIQPAIEALENERKAYKYATIKNPNQLMIVIALNYKKG